MGPVRVIGFLAIRLVTDDNWFGPLSGYHNAFGVTDDNSYLPKANAHVVVHRASDWSVGAWT